MGKMKLPASADSGDISQRKGDLELSFRHEAGGRRLTVNDPAFANGKGLHGELWLDQPDMDRMVIATPFPKAPKAFYYNQKINCMTARGKITLGEETYQFSPESAFAVLDWGRASGRITTHGIGALLPAWSRGDRLGLTSAMGSATHPPPAKTCCSWMVKPTSSTMSHSICLKVRLIARYGNLPAMTIDLRWISLPSSIVTRRPTLAY